jgi:hypothetical protein
MGQVGRPVNLNKNGSVAQPKKPQLINRSIITWQIGRKISGILGITKKKRDSHQPDDFLQAPRSCIKGICTARDDKASSVLELDPDVCRFANGRISQPGRQVLLSLAFTD